ncbi:MAG: type II secretion system F family protein [Clostridiales bacterium]|nr:type II secretion system F family protein [Clostridiales bacterium]
MKRLKEISELLISDRTLSRSLWALTLCTAFIIFILAIKNPDDTGCLIVNKSGEVIGIQRNSIDRIEEYNFKLEVSDKNYQEERALTIRLHPINKDSHKNIEKDSEILYEMEISKIINEIEFSNDNEIILPLKTPAGTVLKWKKQEKRNITTFITISILYVLFVVIMVKNVANKERNEEALKQKAILKGLPRFCNQLWLMMNAGMILSDALDQISNSYENYDENERSFFENELIDIARINDIRRSSTATVIAEFASKYNVKELIRIAVILKENEIRGSDVIENLSRESRYLWENRKILARESGKLIDTRMTYPMGLLLIILIVITMAPALINI